MAAETTAKTTKPDHDWGPEMTRRNLTTSLMVVAAGLLLFGGVALAREQQTRDDHIVPAAIQPAATFDDHGVDASRSPEIQATDDHGVDASRSPEIQATFDDHGVDASRSPEIQATDDHGVDASESPEIQATDDHGVDASESPDASASPSLDDKTPRATAEPTSSVEDGGGHGGSH
jgi:hypothetical protein